MKNSHNEFSTMSDYYSDNETPNDFDFGELSRMAKFREAVTRLQRKCEYLSQNNERLVKRLHYVKKIVGQKKRDVELLKVRLDVYSDDWRTAQPDPLAKVKAPTNLTPTGKIRKPRKNKALNAKDVEAECDGESKPSTADGKYTKRKRSKSDKEKDPNAPKRPANPFFQFCQEQRSILMDELNKEIQPGQPELSKQELTRQLAQRWRSLDPETKQIYVSRYESSKQKYNLEMQSYKKDTNGAGPTTANTSNATTK